MIAQTHLRASSALLAVLAVPVGADVIHRTSGAPIEDCAIVDETLTEVSYKEGGRGKSLSVPADEVLRIEYERVPQLVGEADEFLASGDVDSALDAFDEYLSEHLGGREEKRYTWAPAYAAFRLLEIQNSVGDAAGIVSAAERLIDNFSESRYVPQAYVIMADALFLSDEGGRAQAKLGEFERLIVKKNLSQRWGLECRLARFIAFTRRV